MSCRIDFASSNGTYLIDRTMPGLLYGKMSGGEWTRFCDEIDKAILPAAGMQKKQFCYMGCLIIWILAFIGGMAGVEIGGIGGERGFLSLTALFFVIGMVLLLYVMTSFGRKLQAKSAKIEEEVQEILTKETNSRPDVSFHFRKQRHSNGSVENNNTGFFNYIECIVGGNNFNKANPAVEFPVQGGTANTPLLSDFTGAFGGNGTGTGKKGNTAERLHELEGIIAIISTEEYNSKRQEILNSV